MIAADGDGNPQHGLGTIQHADTGLNIALRTIRGLETLQLAR
jgi:hypothetical protein